MSYREPYPVVTEFPDPNKYNIGDKVCYHYTLSRQQVADAMNTCTQTIKSLSKASSPLVSYATIFGSIFIPILGGRIASAAITTFQLELSEGINDVAHIKDIFETIYNHMLRYNYKRVTISQVFELYEVNAELIKHAKMWRYENPRVPHESYYLKR